MTFPFWDKPTETMDREEIERLQFARFKSTLETALKTDFYRNKFKACGVSSADDVKTMKDFLSLPYTTKDDLRETYPDKLLAVPKRDVVRIHTSSGTTGTPTVIYHTRHDLDVWTDLTARSLVATGSDENDIFQNMMTYGLFTGGLGLHYAAERVGMMVIPVSSGNTKRQIKFLKDFKTTLVHATPSYLLHILAKLPEEGLDVKDLALRRAVIGAEPHSENTRLKIENLLGIDAYNSYGMSEMNGPGVAFECVCKAGMHLWEDSYIMEIIDRDTLLPVPDGNEGELVLTTLRRQATPLIRYRTKDITSIYPDRCECGRTSRRIARIKARTDDMLIINGVNVYPSQIEQAIMKVPEVGTNYQILVEKHGTLDKITVKIEVTEAAFSDDRRVMESLRSRIRDELKASIVIAPEVELHEPGVLPVYEGKAKRVFDEREQL